MIDTKLAVEQEAHARLLHSLFTTALEGGIGYWSAASEYHWAKPSEGIGEVDEDLDGFKAVLHPSPPEEFWGVFDGDADEQPLTVDRDVIERGLIRFQEWMTTDRRNKLGGLLQPESDRPWLSKAYRPTNKYWQQFSTDVTFRAKDVDFDADLADAVVQLGLFDQVVFG